MPERHITFVKKILADGRPCTKCQDVEQRLLATGQIEQIDTVLIADERDPQSEGMRAASQLGVDRAPFFIVKTSQETTVYTVYLKLVKEVFGEAVDVDARQILDAHPSLDLL